MAFEILDPLPPFSSLSPARRVLCVLLALAVGAALIWACDTAARAPELVAAQQVGKLKPH